MRIQIVRNTLAAPAGQPPRPVNVGEVIEVDTMQGQQLIALGKAVASAAPTAAPHLVGIEHAVDPTAVAAEKRTKGRSA